MRPRIGAGAADDRRALWHQLETQPEATLEEYCELWKRERGVRASRSPP